LGLVAAQSIEPGAAPVPEPARLLAGVLLLVQDASTTITATTTDARVTLINPPNDVGFHAGRHSWLGEIPAITDMSEGIIARFKTMAISRSSVLAGHVLGTVLQTVVAVAIVVGVTLLVGFRPNANPVEWVPAIAVLLMVALAFTWLCVTCGLMAKGIETASNLPMLLMLLPFLGSGFAPTDSMPAALR
jgi:hypothetical protein